MKKVVNIFLISLFIIYWLFTFIYVMPPNYLRVKSGVAVLIFDIFLPQKWTFFAPPPKYNFRLYYIFGRNEKTTVIEVLKPIAELKRSKAPFNTNEEIVDYVLNNSVIAIQNHTSKYKSDIEQASTKGDSIKLAQIIHEVEELPEFKTLLNYAKVVAQKNGIDEKNLPVSFYACSIEIPKFSERHKENVEKKELLIVKSKGYTL
jgi:hypothetical protein